MAFNPASLNFTYLPNSGIIPNAPISLTEERDIAAVEVESKPSWLTVIVSDHEYDDSDPPRILTANFIVAVNGPSANILAPGLYSGEVTIKVTVYIGSLPIGTRRRSFSVILRIVENIPLTISPNFFYFFHVNGDPNPSPRPFNINTTNNWSVISSNPAITFSQNNGSGSTLLNLIIDASGFPLGQNDFTFLVDDGINQREATIIVFVSGTSQTDFLDVNPNVLEFSENVGAAPSDDRTFTINSSEASVVSTNVPWLDFSETNVASGFNSIIVSTINTQTLDVGGYPAKITITTASFVKQIDVVLFIIETPVQTIKNNGFYFANDRNTIVLTSPQPNQEALLNYTAQATNTFKAYQKRIPFFQNVLKEIVGLETEVLLVPEPLPVSLSTQVYAPIVPVIYNVTIDTQNMLTGLNFAKKNNTFENLKFINGSKPLNLSTSKFEKNKLTYLPEEITVPVNGIIIVSFRSTSEESSISIDLGIATGTISVGVVDTEIYTAIINLNDYSFSKGDKTTIRFAGFDLKIRFDEQPLDTNQIFYLNEWDIPECINVTGPIRIINEDDSVTVINSKEGKDYEKVINVKTPVSFEVNTGNIYSFEEQEFLSKILRSKKIWLQLNGARYEVIRNFKSIPIFETRNFVENLTLKFNAAES